jgi:hypothetical protein
VAVEKLHFLQNSKNLGDRKCLGKLRKSFVGHPDTILFSRISRERVFQHPRLITTVEEQPHERALASRELGDDYPSPVVLPPPD